MAAGDRRGHGGNAGYDDQIDAYYSWDSKVPNHKNIQVGDPIALWDKERLLGVSVIEEIESSRGTKVLQRCPQCRTTRISRRKTADPQHRYRCMRCTHEFASPTPDVVEVDLYRARYDAAWTSLDGVLDGPEVRALGVHATDINAMRPLDWPAFRQTLVDKRAGRAVDRIAARVDLAWPSQIQLELPQGFARALVRVRRGQREFRQQVLAAQGNVCAFTGSAPERVLEAGHLYSYAQLGTHFEHGGLMLRRDVHRLFDDGALAVDPSHLRIDVGEELSNFPQYAQLHDRPLKLEQLRDVQVEWLAKHWEEHRMAPVS